MLISSFLKSNVSESLKSLMTKERLWANGSGHSPKMNQLLVFSRAGNLLICSSLIRSFHLNQMSVYERFAQIAQDKWATVSKALRSLISKEWPWANGSGRSWQMSHRERYAQVAHDKWANERFAQKILVKILFFSMFYMGFLILKNEWFTHSLFFNELCKWIAQGSPKMSQWANCLFFWANCSFAHFFAKNEQFAQKTDNHIPSPGFFWANCSFAHHLLMFGQKTSDSLRKLMSKFPTLQ